MPRSGGSVKLQTLSRSGASLGGRVWAAAQLTLERLLGNIPAGSIEGAKVLELGAGAGLVGLSALQLGAGSVVLTDTPRAPDVLALLAANATANPHPGTGAVATVCPLEWSDAPLSGLDGAFDIVFASDVLYEAPAAKPLASAIAIHLARPHGVAHVVCPDRLAPDIMDAFVGAARMAGMASERHRWDTAEGGFEYMRLYWTAGGADT
jgi:predicted nicotinamide N-methyase